MSRREDVVRFYEILDDLEQRVGGRRRLEECDGRMGWPNRGVYFFFEEGEVRSTSGTGPRVVRVGTHAVSAGSRTTLWDRLRTHRGSLKTGGGSHRASVFRLLVGAALGERHPELNCPTWRKRNSAPKGVREAEHELERAVSRHIRKMPFLWVGVDDPPSKDSLRAHIERNAIALLSGWGSGAQSTVDPPSGTWLGRHCSVGKVRDAGLWNSRSVDGQYEHGFLRALQGAVRMM